MKAHELRTADELREDDGTLIYRIKRAWTHTDVDGVVVVRVDVRYADGGDAVREFNKDTEVPHVRPTSRERIARYVALHKRISENGGQLGELIHDLDGGDRAGGSTLFLRDLEAVLEELDAARSYID